MEISRRSVLIGLAASAPLATAISTRALAGDDNDELMKVSRVIVGRDDLEPAIGARIQDALSGKITDFGAKLSALAKKLGANSDRDAALASLDDAEIDVALAIAQPWYTGVVGIGSEHAYDDGAIFVTFLGAEAMRAVSKPLPWQSYPVGGPGWWADAPDGVTAPPMPPEIREWSYVPPGVDRPVATASAKFLEMVTVPQKFGEM